jgi:glyoxylase-like metal-dependent hydrolase (beta-lactamase superfamily II)
MDITPFHEPDSGTWSYLLADRSSKSAAIIDPVWVYDPVSGMADIGFTERILRLSEERGYTIDWVLETHAHADHLTAADQIRKRTGARIGAGRGICSVQATFARVFNLPQVHTDGRQFDRLFGDGDTLSLGELEIRVMETPGHTNDSVTYVVGDAAFIGDTMFAPEAGTARCDFPGGDAGQLFDSIGRILALPDATRLFLCHNYPKAGEDPVSQVTVAQSKEENIHLKSGTTREQYVAMRTERDAQLALPRLILPSLIVNIEAGSAPRAEDNGVSYLRTPFNTPIADILAASGGKAGQGAP